MKNKILAVLLAVLGLCSVSQAQTCSVQLASSPSQPIILSDVESGSATTNNLMVTGGGLGIYSDKSPWVSQEGYNIAARTQVAPHTDFTATVFLYGVTGVMNNGTTEEGAGAGIIAIEAGSRNTREVSWGVHLTNGGNYLELRTATSNSNQWNNKSILFSQLGFLPYLKVQRAGLVWTFYDSSDGVNWNQLTTVTDLVNPPGYTYVGIGAWSGDQNGTVGDGVFNNFTVNGVVVTPPFNDGDAGTTGVSGSAEPAIQSGTLTLGLDSGQGAVIYSFVGTGCDPGTVAGLQTRINNSSFEMNYNIVLYDNTTATYILQVEPAISQPVCYNCVAFFQMGTQDNATLVSGHRYTLTKTVNAYFIDLSGAWTEFQPIIRVQQLNP